MYTSLQIVESHSGEGVKSNLAWKGCNLCQKGESQQHHSQTEICSVRVGGSLYPRMLTVLSSTSFQDLPDWWLSDFLLLKLGISVEQLFSLQLTTLACRKNKNRKKHSKLCKHTHFHEFLCLSFSITE